MGKETENVCPCCGESNFETDIEGGFIVCTDCGTLIKENIIVAEVEFQDHGTSSRAVGKFVADEGQGCIGPGGMIQATNERSGASIAKARRNISMIANNPLINLPSNVVDAAVVYYKFALGGNLTRARCCSYIAVACLYIVCRLKQTSHLLIDFSEVTQTDVFVLGKVYQTLARSMNIYLPLVDPCLYVERFGYKLKLGEKTREVSHTAVRLVGRMKRDWIHHGRRPNGICGAALLVAAKLHGFQISIQQMVRVVRIGKDILLKRLTDVSKTPAASLSLKDIFTKKLEDLVDQDPPSFQLARINYIRRSTLESQNEWLSSNIIDQVIRTNQEMEVVMGIREAIKMGIDSIHNTHELIPIPEERVLRSKKVSKTTQGVKEQPLASILEPDAPLEPYSPTKQQVPDEEDREEEIDDDEINEYILNNEEVRMKTTVWHNEYDAFLKLKEERKTAKEFADQSKKRRISKGPRRRMMGLTQMTVDNLLSGTHFANKSSKINYEALEKLEQEDINGVKSFGAPPKTENIIDIFLDPKRYTEVVDMRVPDHILKKYEEKNKNAPPKQQVEIPKTKPKKNSARQAAKLVNSKKTKSPTPDIPITPDSPIDDSKKSMDDSFSSQPEAKRKKMSLDEELYRKNVIYFGFENFEKDYDLPEEDVEEEFFEEHIY